MADYGVTPTEHTLKRIALVVNDCRLKGEAATIDPSAFSDYGKLGSLFCFVLLLFYVSL